jgi:predicted small integral membrane protein
VSCKTFLVLFAVVALIDSRSFWRQVGDARPDPDPSRPLDHATRSDRLLVGLLGFGIIVIPTLGSGAWMGPQILLMLFLHGQAVISLGCLALATGTAMLINTLLLERWERRHGK